MLTQCKILWVEEKKKTEQRNGRQDISCVFHGIRIWIPCSILKFWLFCFYNCTWILIIPPKVGGNLFTTYGGGVGFHCQVNNLFIKPTVAIIWDSDSVTSHYYLSVNLLICFLPSCSPKCWPLSVEMTRSSSMSHLFPTRITWALSQEYVLIWVDLKEKVGKEWSEESRRT